MVTSQQGQSCVFTSPLKYAKLPPTDTKNVFLEPIGTVGGM